MSRMARPSTRVIVVGSISSLLLVALGALYVSTSRPVGGMVFFSLGALGIAAAIRSHWHRRQEDSPISSSWQSERRKGAVIFFLFLAGGVFSIYAGTRGDGIDLAIGIVLSIIPLLVGALGLWGVVRAGDKQPDDPRT